MRGEEIMANQTLAARLRDGGYSQAPPMASLIRSASCNAFVASVSDSIREGATSLERPPPRIALLRPR
jgi:hypothetical protein